MRRVRQGHDDAGACRQDLLSVVEWLGDGTKGVAQAAPQRITLSSSIVWTSRESVKDLIADARTQIENLPAAEMARALEAPDVLLVDLREPGERVQHGTIAGALAAPRGMLESYADPATRTHKKEFDPSRRILLYCASGGRSALAGATLKRLGFARVAHLDGGFKAWKEAGREIVPVQV